MIDKNYIGAELRSNMYKSVYNLLEACNAMIIGGALTSILTRKEINDIDVYFKNEFDFVKAVLDLKNHKYVDSYDLLFLCSTDKSVTFNTRNPKTGEELKVQFIHQSFYKSVVDVFDDFDFTINMIGYDLAEKKVYHNKNTMQHLAQRLLCVNTNTKFPLVSVLRVGKYEDRGYSISKKEMIKLLLRLTSLEINSYEDVKKHVGGMYGKSIDQLLDTTKPFSIDEVLKQLNALEYNAYENMRFEAESFDKYIEGMLEEFDYTNLPYLKFVLKTDEENVFKSWYDKDFEYKIGETVIPKMGSWNSGIHCNKNFGQLYYSGGEKEDHTLILLIPVEPDEVDRRFPSGMEVIEAIHDVYDEDDWIEWLCKYGYITKDVRNRMDIYFDGEKIFSGKLKKDTNHEVPVVPTVPTIPATLDDTVPF